MVDVQTKNTFGSIDSSIAVVKGDLGQKPLRHINLEVQLVVVRPLGCQPILRRWKSEWDPLGSITPIRVTTYARPLVLGIGEGLHRLHFYNLSS